MLALSTFSMVSRGLRVGGLRAGPAAVATRCSTMAQAPPPLPEHLEVRRRMPQHSHPRP